MKILVVEDDRRIANILAEILRDQHYIVEVAEDGQAGLNFAQASQYDLILLDLMLPKIDGLTLCQRLRQTGDQTLILMLTSRDTSLDKVAGLDVGADDYVVKPFDPPELLARIRALVRRGKSTGPNVMEWERLRLDPSHCEVRYGAQLLKLTPKEYGLLELFLRSGDRVLSYDVILEQLWTFDDLPNKETVKTHLRGLRQKLKAAGAPSNLIENVYGLGYRLNPNL
ncbi:MAG: response regulator transcription factor [Leptolyngbyaceae cyanobacterium MO_188.B28]|nr:response regulator transcription factor [Leptolyngbyaceae cyanobacterium MO_188.B28]